MKPFSLFLILITFLSCQKQEGRKQTDMAYPKQALLFVFQPDEQQQFWADFKQNQFSILKDWQQQGEIAYALPFTHKPLQHPSQKGTWSDCLLLGVADNADVEKMAIKLTSELKKAGLSETLKSVDWLSAQEGLEMIYSKENGLQNEQEMEQIVEYVFSKPAARETYYKEQHLFSGPAMQELHNNNMAGRFIGFTVNKRLYGQDFPQWDLLHVVGFTPEQTEKVTPIFMETWDKHAARAFGEGMTFMKKKADWDTIRQNIKSDAVQLQELTLQCKGCVE